MALLFRKAHIVKNPCLFRGELDQISQYYEQSVQLPTNTTHFSVYDSCCYHTLHPLHCFSLLLLSLYHISLLYFTSPTQQFGSHLLFFWHGIVKSIGNKMWMTAIFSNIWTFWIFYQVNKISLEKFCKTLSHFCSCCYLLEKLKL